MNMENNTLTNETMEYCYCFRCNKIKESGDLTITPNGLQCRQCGGYNLGEAGWVACPYNKMSAVKCPMAGKGIIDTANGVECMDRCYFRSL